MTHRSASIRGEWLRSPLAWHYVGLAVLVLLVAALAARLGMDWAAANRGSAGELAARRLELRALKMETEPLHGLSGRVAASRANLDQFYKDRIPANYSSIAMRIGELEVKSGAHLSRVQYAQGAADANLAEITMDVGISGEYPQIMRFVNGLERDQTFFVIRKMALTGQQGGMVNLRLQMSTWLRPADAASSGVPKAQPGTADAGASGKEEE